MNHIQKENRKKPVNHKYEYLPYNFMLNCKESQFYIIKELLRTMRMRLKF